MPTARPPIVSLPPMLSSGPSCPSDYAYPATAVGHGFHAKVKKVVWDLGLERCIVAATEQPSFVSPTQKNKRKRPQELFGCGILFLLKWNFQGVWCAVLALGPPYRSPPKRRKIWCICVPQLGLIFTTSARGDSICGIGLPSLLPKLIRETTTKTTCIKGLAYEQNRLLLHF